MIEHYYHVFADGAWETPLAEHFALLESSGLADAIKESGGQVHVGIVGSVENRARVLPEIARDYVSPEVPQEDAGWEHVTLERLIEDLDGMESAAVLYAHTKGAWANAEQDTPPETIELNDAWRRSMEADTVANWKECVELLGEFDAVGSHRIMPPEGGGYYGGNFWWATAAHLKTLPDLDHGTRYHAESWIASNPEADLAELRSGWPAHENFAPTA